jgi:hypothetical protein
MLIIFLYVLGIHINLFSDAEKIKVIELSLLKVYALSKIKKIKM